MRFLSWRAADPRRRSWMGRLAVLLTPLLLWLPAANVLAAAGPAKTIVNVADTRGLHPGLSKWIADLYNTSLWQFSLVVVVVMAVMGLLLGFVCDRLVRLLGVNLGRIQRHE
jgi:hypothetical protein